jgi:eukaryotic-like serine/threonine-protein kinase
MGRRPLKYQWEWELKSPPETLWPLVADTNRFDRDIGLPALELRCDGRTRSSNGRRSIGIRLFGMRIGWDESPFEWIWPHRYSVLRRYHSGPISEMAARFELFRSGGGTRLVATLGVTPRNLLGRLFIPVQVGILSGRAMNRIYPRYDLLAQRQDLLSAPEDAPAQLAPGALRPWFHGI